MPLSILSLDAILQVHAIRFCIILIDKNVNTRCKEHSFSVKVLGIIKLNKYIQVKQIYQFNAIYTVQKIS